MESEQSNNDEAGIAEPSNRDAGSVSALEVDEDVEEYPSAFHLAMIVIAILLSMFIVNLDTTIVATAIPRITDQFHSLDQVGWYGSAFFLTIASFQSTWGKAYKYLPLKPTFLTSIAFFELGSLICAVAPNSTALIIGRAIAGAGGAGVGAGAYTIIAFAVPPRQRPAYSGLVGATYCVAAFVGPLLGGVFTDKLSWRWCFYVNLPIGGVSAAIILLSFKAPKAARPVEATWREKLWQMDLPGTFTIMAAVVCYLLALQWGGTTKSWSNSSVIGTLVGFVLLMILFGIIEYFMGDRALLQGRLMRQRRIWTTSAFTFFLAGSYFTLIYYIPVYFQSIKGASASNSGVRNLPLVISTALFSILAGGLITTWGHWVPLMVIGSALATVGCGLIYTLNIDSPAREWIGYQALAGIGVGLATQVPLMANQALTEPSDLSSVSAIMLFFLIGGGAVFVTAGQSAFANTMLKKLPITAPDVNPAIVLATGATELRSILRLDQIPGVLVAYMDGLKVTYALCIALAGVSTIFAVMPKWERIKAAAKKEGEKGADDPRAIAVGL